MALSDYVLFDAGLLWEAICEGNIFLPEGRPREPLQIVGKG